MDATLRAAVAAAIEPGSLLMVVRGSDEQPTEVALVPPGRQTCVAAYDDVSVLAAAVLHLAARLQAIEVEVAAFGFGTLGGGNGSNPEDRRRESPLFPAPCPGDLWDTPAESLSNA